MGYKQVILVRMDLKLPKGKLAAQVAHAAVESAHRSEKGVFQKWRDQGMKKIVLKINSVEEIYQYKARAKERDVGCAVITDAGRTVVEPGTVTCLGIGPASEQEIDAITGDLKIL